MDVDIVILAAGKGTRMRSERAKVLHELAGKPLIHHVVDTARQLTPRQIAVVVGHQSEQVQDCLDNNILCVEQAEQNGTGHAVQLALQQLPSDGITLVLYGDVPLIQYETLAACVAATEDGSVALVTAEFNDPAQLGRIVRDANGGIESIVEFKDANAQQRDITEINSGILAAPTHLLAGWMGRLQPNNAQGELYLTDAIAMARQDGIPVQGITAQDEAEVTGINDRLQLAQVERAFQSRLTSELMRSGVTLMDPSRVDIRGSVEVSTDTVIDVNVVLQGDVKIGKNSYIGPGVVITDAKIGDGVRIEANTTIESAVIGNECTLGPFARIRPGSELSDRVKIGNFVETKKTTMGEGSKANHLAYLGDATIGADCNVGAGAVTCNYDGVNKHPTTIGDNVFVGTNSTMVAPLEIADGAYVAAGSTVTTKVGAGDLAVGRARQRNISGWVRPDQRGK